MSSVRFEQRKDGLGRSCVDSVWPRSTPSSSERQGLSGAPGQCQRRVMRAGQTPHAGSVGLGTGSGYARANGHRGRCRVLKHVDDDVAVSTVGGLVQYRCRADDVVGSVTIEGVGADRMARVCGDNRCAGHKL
jgi:hypothetical protein